MAPSRDLAGVPSRSTRRWSTSRWSTASMPTSSGPISSSTAETAFSTPLPPKRSGSPSRSSTRLVLARGRARRHGRAGQCAVVERDLDLDRRVAPRVEDLACPDLLDDRHHCSVPRISAGPGVSLVAASTPQPGRMSSLAVRGGCPYRGTTMTSTPDSLFESFRRAEMLVARSRPLDALQALLPGARRPARQRLGAAARGPRLPQLRPARAGRGGVHPGAGARPGRSLRPLRAGQGAAAAGPPGRGARPVQDGRRHGPAAGVPGGARRGAGADGARGS